MEVEVLTYPNKKQLKPNFYIQVKGLHSGRPIKTPIVNCVAVYSDFPYLFEIVYLLWNGRKFESDIIGSVVPFIRIDAIKKIIALGLESYRPEKKKLLEKINLIDQVVVNHKEQIKLYQRAQMAICAEFLR